MKKLTFGEPQVLAQSTTAAILFDGYQDPNIRKGRDGSILVKYHARRDCDETFGQEDADPVLKSVDGGKTWDRCKNDEWVEAGFRLQNGDIISFRERANVPRPADLPEPPENRRNAHVIANTCAVASADEVEPYLGKALERVAHLRRIKAGTDEAVEESAPIRWSNMPVRVYEKYLRPAGLGGSFAQDKNGTLWTTAHEHNLLPDGTLSVNYLCVHLFRSDDNGHSWDYVSTIDYRMEYNDPHCIDLEGFNENSIMLTDSGDLFLVMRSGSLHPFIKGDPAHPAPKLYCARSSDEGKTWDVKPFYDFGILPVSVRLACGTTLLVSGRPGVYVTCSDDPELREWSEPEFLVRVPEEDVYDAYYEYSCSNTGIVALDDRTAMIVYSNFKLTAPDDKRAKSIVVQTVTVSDE